MLSNLIVAALMAIPSFATPAEDSSSSCAVELEALHELAEFAVPDDASSRGRLVDWIRRALTARDAEHRRAGDVALQALHRLRSLDYVFVDPRATSSIENAPKGWILGEDYDRNWAKTARRGGTLLFDVMTPSLFGWELSAEIDQAIELLEELGYRWSFATRTWERSDTLPKLSLTENEP